MLVLCLLVLCASALCAKAHTWPDVCVRPPPDLYDLEDAENIFEEFIKKFDKVYASEQEKQKRFNIFKEGLKQINELRMSEKGKKISFDINHLSDWTREEFISSFGWKSDPNYVMPEPENFTITEDLPETFDWRDSGNVSPVKNQDVCGSCWAFSITGAIEAQYSIKYQQMLSFSEQQILDCDNTDNACDGGYPPNALKYLQSVDGIELESDYPYEHKDDQCRFDPSRVHAKIIGQKLVDMNDAEAIKQALVTYGPISVGIAIDDVNLDWFHKYHGGLDECPDGEKNHHAVLLVGYGTENGQPYWTIKNSWGDVWGEQGYMRFVQEPTACGMYRQLGTIPVLE